MVLYVKIKANIFEVHYLVTSCHGTLVTRVQKDVGTENEDTMTEKFLC